VGFIFIGNNHTNFIANCHSVIYLNILLILNVGIQPPLGLNDLLDGCGIVLVGVWEM